MSNACKLKSLEVVPRKVYLAASMDAQSEARRVAILLIDAGFEVTSTWIRKDFSNRPAPGYHREAFDKAMGAVDVADLERADTLLMLTAVPSSSGGFHVELGYFLGAKRDNIVVVGDKPNVFFQLDQVRHFTKVDDALSWLTAAMREFNIGSLPILGESDQLTVPPVATVEDIPW